jgi:hypothetical protein
MPPIRRPPPLSLRRNDFRDRPLEDGRWAYEIEVRSRTNVFDVEVDADKGTVIATAEGRPGAKDDKPDWQPSNPRDRGGPIAVG